MSCDAVMSSEHSEEQRSEGRGERKPGHAAAEEEGEQEDAHRPQQEEPAPRHPLSPDLQAGQEVMSQGGEERVQRAEARTSSEGETKRSDYTALSPARKHRASAEQYVRRSLARSLTSCPVRERRRQLDEPRGPGPFYFFGGANGAEIVSSYCESRGWKRIYNKHREDFKLKWCETKSPVNYSNFRQGQQLVFQIPNNNVLTTKIGLLSSLREYERVSSKVKHGQGLRRLRMEEFIPTTFRMDIREEQEDFFAQQEGVSKNQSQMWICKPTGMNQGRGIFLLKSPEDVAALRHKLQDSQGSRKTHQRQPQARIVQKYIQNPLLLKGRKFDVRSYLLIACTTPYMVFFRHGYVRLTCDLYDPNTNNMSAHLTNQCMQKKNPLYSLVKEDTVWSMESFNTYVNDRFAVVKDLPRDWVLGLFTKRMQQIMTQCFLAVQSKLDCRLGFFDLIGCDFMIDEGFTVWLLEMNCNPALHTNCSVLKEVIPSAVQETLDLTLEIFNKCRHGQRILPLANQRDFVLLFKGVFCPNAVVPFNMSRADTNCDVIQKASRKNLKVHPRRWRSGLQSQTEPSVCLNSSKNMLAGGEEKCSPCAAYSTSAPHHGLTLNSSHRSRRQKVQLKLSTFHNQLSTVVTPNPKHDSPLECVDAGDTGDKPSENETKQATESTVTDKKEEP